MRSPIGDCPHFLEWASRALVPLIAQSGDAESLAGMIGDASVVALGEGEHTAAEPLELRNRLFQHLVEQNGFTAIALESGVVESRTVNDYVHGAPGCLDTVLCQGIGWGFHRLPQNRALVHWLRQYNANAPRGREVSFYGFDVPGSPSNTDVSRGVRTALEEALRCLDQMDEASAASFRRRLGSLFPRLHFDFSGVATCDGYPALDRGERDELTAVIADLISLIERKEAQLTQLHSQEACEWALRAAIGARQVDSWLRQIPLDWDGSRLQMRFMDLASEVRDRAQADNIDWILRREAPHGRVLLFAHNAHVSAAPTRWSYQSLDQHGEGSDAGISHHQPAGTYLQRRLGHRLVTIGHAIGQGRIGCAGSFEALAAAHRQSLDGMCRVLGVPAWLLDLRGAPAEVMHELEEAREIGRGFEWRGHYRHSLHLSPAKAYDILFYTDSVTPACPEAAGHAQR